MNKTYLKCFKLDEKEKAKEWLEKTKKKAKVVERFCNNEICYEVTKLQRVY